MSLPLVFHPQVDDDIKEAFRWYETQRHGLGDDFIAAIEEVLQRVQKIPKIHQVIHTRHPARHPAPVSLWCLLSSSC